MWGSVSVIETLASRSGQKGELLTWITTTIIVFWISAVLKPREYCSTLGMLRADIPFLLARKS